MEIYLTLIAILGLMFCHIQEAFTEYCGENIFCHPPYRCCEVKNECCYDSVLHTNRHLRLQIWNMWYFWFLIIFMLMSCFGGCGYYRRRRLAMLSSTNTGPSSRPVTVLTSRPVTMIASQRRPQRAQSNRNRFGNMYTYTGPEVNFALPSTNLPPAYSEVVSQPGLYPINKTELPPYPGYKSDDCMQNIPVTTSGMPINCDDCLPPPYSEHPPDEPLSEHQLNGVPVHSILLPPNTNLQNNSGN